MAWPRPALACVSCRWPGAAPVTQVCFFLRGTTIPSSAWGVGETRCGPLAEHAMQAQRQKSRRQEELRGTPGHDVLTKRGKYCAGKRCEPGNFWSRPLVGCFNWQIASVSQPFIDGHSRLVRQGLALKVGMALKISSQCRRQDHGFFIPHAATSPGLQYCRIA